MIQKRVAGIACVLLASMALLIGCPNDPPSKSGENNITSFKIGNAAGVIWRETISVIVPVGTSLSALTPEITLSGGASVSPASGTANDFSHPTSYLVKAENGATKTYAVNVVAEAAVVLDSISVISPPYKTAYEKGASIDIAGLVVEGTYSDGSTRPQTIIAANISNYDSSTTGTQSVVVTVNGKTTTFNVTVTEVTLLSLAVSGPYKTTYEKGNELDLDGLVVRGTYSDGSVKIETVTAANISNYDKDKVGTQYLVVTVGGKTATFPVSVVSSGQLSLTVGLVKNGNDELEIYGVPASGIKLSVGKKNGLPDSIVISAGGLNSTVYSAIQWYIDGTSYATNNIITINAGSYTFTKPHTITIVATKDTVQYSKTITFTVER